MDGFLLRSEILQWGESAVPQVLFGAGHFSWEGTSRRNHAWQRVCGSMYSEIMLLILSAASVQDLGRALGSPARIFQAVHQVTLTLPDQMCGRLGRAERLFR